MRPATWMRRRAAGAIQPLHRAHSRRGARTATSTSSSSAMNSTHQGATFPTALMPSGPRSTSRTTPISHQCATSLTLSRRLRTPARSCASTRATNRTRAWNGTTMHSLLGPSASRPIRSSTPSTQRPSTRPTPAAWCRPGISSASRAVWRKCRLSSRSGMASGPRSGSLEILGVQCMRRATLASGPGPSIRATRSGTCSPFPSRASPRKSQRATPTLGPASIPTRVAAPLKLTLLRWATQTGATADSSSPRSRCLQASPNSTAHP
mmetsp:Transcript_4002/g.11317  ORF Transcript_4002/g.11317 Transcript_4002/m.11317 type:complete len:265 (+) Transcript_4002:66-860(+)